MLAQEVAHRYASALFLSAKEKDLLDAVYEDVTSLRTLIRSDRSMLDFLTAPQVLEEDQVKFVREVFRDRLNRLLVEFLVVLVHKHRVRFLKEIIDEYEELFEDERNIGRATVVTAVKLTDDERRSITQRLARHTGKSIKLQEKVDRSILGGMIAMYDGEIIDGSVRHSLTVLRDELNHLRVH